MPRIGQRSKPLLIAPLIPLWGLLGFFGVKEFDRSRFLLFFFVCIWVLLLVALAGYIVRQARQARRTRLDRAISSQQGGSR